MECGNIAFRDDTFTSIATSGSPEQAMTVEGTVRCAGILLGWAALAAVWSWTMFYGQNRRLPDGYLVAGLVFALLVAATTIIRKKWALITAPIYAFLEGFCLGGLCAHIGTPTPGAPAKTVALTFGALFSLLVAYRWRPFRTATIYTRVVVAAGGGVAVVSLFGFGLAMLGVREPSMLPDGAFGMLINVVLLVVAALTLVATFDFIESGERSAAPKYMEWYAAFGLIVALVWLYFELLRLVSNVRRLPRLQ